MAFETLGILAIKFSTDVNAPLAPRSAIIAKAISLTLRPQELLVIPVNAWLNLWLKIYLLTLGTPENEKGKPIKGKLFILGTKLYRHQNSANIRFYGVLDDGKKKHNVIISRSSYIVADMTIDDIWIHTLKDEAYSSP